MRSSNVKDASFDKRTKETTKKTLGSIPVVESLSSDIETEHPKNLQFCIEFLRTQLTGILFDLVKQQIIPKPKEEKIIYL